MEQYSNKMRSFDKKQKRTQMEQKRKFLKYVENEWLVMKNLYSLDYPFTFVKHFIEKKNNRWRIKQLVLSGYLEQDGLYILNDYDLTEELEEVTNERKLKMTLWDFQLQTGYLGENKNTNSYEELFDELLRDGYISEKEIRQIFSKQDFHLDKKEIVLLPGIRKEERRYVTS